MRRFLIVLSICLIGIITYIPSLRAKLFWDDDDFILQNRYVTEFQIDKFFTGQAVEGAGKQSNYFRPIQFVTYAIVYKFFGPSPIAFHTLSIGFHIVATFSVYFFLSFFSISFFVRLVVSLLFLIHPVQTEAVSYASGLSDPLVATFGFLSLGLLFQSLNFHQKIRARGTVDIRIKPYLVSVFLFILALLSKESGVIFLGVLGAILLTESRTRRMSLRTIAAVSIPFAFTTLCYLLYHRIFIDILDLQTLYGTTPYTQSVILRLITFFSLIPSYLGILIAPVTLFYERDFRIPMLSSVWHLPSIIVLFSFFVVGSILLYRTNKEKKHSTALWAFFSFIIAFIPFSGLVLINGIMYEHFLYIPLVFFFLWIFSIVEKWQSSKPKTHAFFLFSIFFFLLIGRSWSRQFEWQDPVRLYTQTLHFAPTSYRVWNNLGMEYDKRNQLQDAKHAFEQAIQNNPTIPNSYHNMGNILFKEKNYIKAEEFFSKAIDVAPTFGYSYVALLHLYQETGNQEKAQEISEEITTRFRQ